MIDGKEEKGKEKGNKEKSKEKEEVENITSLNHKCPAPLERGYFFRHNKYLTLFKWYVNIV